MGQASPPAGEPGALPPRGDSTCGPSQVFLHSKRGWGGGGWGLGRERLGTPRPRPRVLACWGRTGPRPSPQGARGLGGGSAAASRPPAPQGPPSGQAQSLGASEPGAPGSAGAQPSLRCRAPRGARKGRGSGETVCCQSEKQWPRPRDTPTLHIAHTALQDTPGGGKGGGAGLSQRHGGLGLTGPPGPASLPHRGPPQPPGGCGHPPSLGPPQPL